MNQTDKQKEAHGCKKNSDEKILTHANEERLVLVVEEIKPQQRIDLGAAVIQRFEGSDIYIVGGEVEDSGISIIQGDVELDG